MSLSGFAKCLRNIQQFNFFNYFFYTGLILPLRNVQTIVDVKNDKDYNCMQILYFTA